MWKDLPSWLKGGIIGMNMFIVLGPLLYLCGRVFYSSIVANFFGIFMTPGLYIFIFFIRGSFVSVLIGNFILWLGLGSFIGWIVGKIKSRKQNI